MTTQQTVNLSPIYLGLLKTIKSYTVFSVVLAIYINYLYLFFLIIKRFAIKRQALNSSLFQFALDKFPTQLSPFCVRMRNAYSFQVTDLLVGKSCAIQKANSSFPLTFLVFVGHLQPSPIRVVCDK